MPNPISSRPPEMPHPLPHEAESVKPPPSEARPPAQFSADVPLRSAPRIPVSDIKSLRNIFKASADALDLQAQKLAWYQKIPGLSAEPALRRQQALHNEASQHVSSFEEANLADALLKLPGKNQPASIKTALDMTREGNKLLPDVASGAAKTGSKEQIAQLQWALYSKGVQQQDATAKAKGGTREPLIGGMTVLEDGGRVAKFMKSAGAHYDRPSSHFKETRIGSDGMDFKEADHPLPANKKTLLFGTVNHGQNTYIKGEYSGYATLGDRLSHIGDFIKTNIFGIREPGRREKFIPPGVDEKYAELAGPALTAKDDKKGLKERGIAYMLSRLPKDRQGEFKTYLQSESLNNADMRKGEEIIIPANQLGVSDPLASQDKSVRENTTAIMSPHSIRVRVNDAISKAFGSGIAVPPKYAESLKSLEALDPALAQQLLDALASSDPAQILSANIALSQRLPSLADGKGLTLEQSSNIMNLAVMGVEQHTRMNTQFRTDTSSISYSKPDTSVFNRWRGAEQQFSKINDSRQGSNPSKSLSEELRQEARSKGFDDLHLRLGIDPDIGITNGHAMIDNTDGFQSALALQQGDRAALMTDHLPLAGANGLSSEEKLGIMNLLTKMEQIGETTTKRRAAFDRNFQPMDGATYLTPEKREELKQKLLKFAEDRDETIKQLFTSVTGHSPLSAEQVDAAVSSAVNAEQAPKASKLR